jgi:hypothetical protein
LEKADGSSHGQAILPNHHQPISPRPLFLTRHGHQRIIILQGIRVRPPLLHAPFAPSTRHDLIALVLDSLSTCSFSNTLRNNFLASSSAGIGNSLPKATSTGTTIVGCLFGNIDQGTAGIVLGADTRATEVRPRPCPQRVDRLNEMLTRPLLLHLQGPIVADKNCEKVRLLIIPNPNQVPPFLPLASAHFALPSTPSHVPLYPSSSYDALDPLHLPSDPLLWCWNRRRHRIHDRPHLLQHRAPLARYRPKA